MTMLMNKKQEIKNRIDLINKGETPTGYKKSFTKVLPKDWNEDKLETLCIKRTETAGNRELETLSISAGIGFVNQAQKFGRELSGKQYEHYIIINKGDFAYNKGNSKKYPQGCVYLLEDREEAAVPNVFNTFKLKSNCINGYYKQLFQIGYLNQQLHKYINFGVRNDGLLNLYDSDFYNVLLPCPNIKEQEKIAEILSCCDKAIELKEKLLNEQNKQKEWIQQNILTGKQRLKGFNKAWEKLALKNIFTEHKKISTGIEEVHSVAVKKGIVNQLEHLGKCCAAEDTSNYNLVEPGDVVYTKSPTGKFPYGIIKQSKLTYNAIVSPLYGVFKPKTFELGAFLDEYFSSSVNTNNYLKPIIQKGAKNTINITNTTFLSNYVKIPTDIFEQKAIYNLISINNKKISILEQELEQYKQLKKSLSQLLLTGIVRVNEV